MMARTISYLLPFTIIILSWTFSFSFNIPPNLLVSKGKQCQQKLANKRCLMIEPFGEDITETDINSGPSFSAFKSDSEQLVRNVQLFNHLPRGPTDYYEVWDQQKQLVAEKKASLAVPNEQPLDSVILVEHQPIYTLGTGSTPSHLRFDPESPPPGLGLVRVERGGEVTYHGPGQVVMYPILDLRNYQCDLHWYLRSLEEVIIQALAKMGIEGERIDGLTGVWVKGSKVAAIGVKASRWITMHGISLNVHPEMDHFSHIIPCGIDDRPVCSVKNIKPEVTMELAAQYLLQAFEEVFGTRIQQNTKNP